MSGKDNNEAITPAAESKPASETTTDKDGEKPATSSAKDIEGSPGGGNKWLDSKTGVIYCGQRPSLETNQPAAAAKDPPSEGLVDEELAAKDETHGGDMTSTAIKETKSDDTEADTKSTGKDSGAEISGEDANVDLAAAAGKDAGNNLDAKEKADEVLPEVVDPENNKSDDDVVLTTLEATTSKPGAQNKNSDDEVVLTTPAVKKSTPGALCVGTKLCSWFRNAEAFINCGAEEVDKV
jgi:hypothetical protein